MSPDSFDDLVNVVAQMTGLTPMLAPGTVRRALRDVGADPTAATARELLLALPQLRARLRAFVTEHEARARARRIESYLTDALAAQGEAAGG